MALTQCVQIPIFPSKFSFHQACATFKVFKPWSYTPSVSETWEGRFFATQTCLISVRQPSKGECKRGLDFKGLNATPGPVKDRRGPSMPFTLNQCGPLWDEYSWEPRLVGTACKQVLRCLPATLSRCFLDEARFLESGIGQHLVNRLPRGSKLE